ncbi:hypothetical protein MMAD_49000 [Mycolicibacterium madagascariense]|uniref:Uncharacterized protein n=1 Tax=Mycolicibacterium madagascariense TaxID=212765 RepID=A0A7I7XN56_9MYCO|nr:hypothetical protein MMAD_49000 [Mycolicibacterium madagascariense]
MGRAELGEGMGAGYLHRIRIAPRGNQPFTLGLADAELLGEIGVVVISRGHDVPA